MDTLLENDLKLDDEVIYSGLGRDRSATIIKRTKRSITLKCHFSKVKLTFKSGIPAEDIGLRRAHHDKTI